VTKALSALRLGDFTSLGDSLGCALDFHYWPISDRPDGEEPCVALWADVSVAWIRSVILRLLGEEKGTQALSEARMAFGPGKHLVMFWPGALVADLLIDDEDRGAW
jgi:hypothetical protein